MIAVVLTLPTSSQMTWEEAGYKALITKVRVLGHNGVTVVACELPNRLIGRTLEAKISDVRTLGIFSGQDGN
jgi:hypothetical protein